MSNTIADRIAAQLDFTVLEDQLRNVRTDTISKYKALVRSDTGAELAVVQESYNTLQPSQMYEWCEPIKDRLGLEYDHLHIMNGGRSFVLQMRLPETDLIAGEPSTRNIFIGNGYGTISVRTGSGWERAVCGNTWTFLQKEARGNQTYHRIRHTANMQDRLNEAAARVLEYNSQFDNMVPVANALAEIRADNELVDNVAEMALGEKPDNDATQVKKTKYRNQLDKFMDSVYHETNAAIEGTVWGLFNGVTHYFNHGKNRRGDNKEVNAFRDVTEGPASNVINGVWTVLAEMADGTMAPVEHTEYAAHTNLLDSILDNA